VTKPLIVCWARAVCEMINMNNKKQRLMHIKIRCMINQLLFALAKCTSKAT
jgi:hypothetical protein